MPMYRVAGQELSLPVLVAFEDEPIVTAVTKQRGELALECKLWRGGKVVAVVRGDRMFAGSDQDLSHLYEWKHLPTGQRVVDRENKRVILELA